MGWSEQENGMEVMKEIIQKEIQSIAGLEERVIFKELMEGVFMSLYETNLKMYEELERRVKEELDYDKNRYQIKTGIIEREFFDASHHLLFPMEEKDLEGNLYDMKEILRAVAQEGFLANRRYRYAIFSRYSLFSRRRISTFHSPAGSWVSITPSNTGCACNSLRISK